MTRVAALALGVALLASACGGKPASNAAEISPADALAFVSLPPQPEQPLTRRALEMVWPSFQARIDRARWAHVAETRVEIAELPDHRLVAYTQLKDTKRLDAAHLPHERMRGWTVFAPTKSALTAARTKRHLADLPWFGAASAAAGQKGITGVVPGAWSAVSAEDGTVRTTIPVRGRDQPHTLANDVPADAVAAEASHDARRLLEALPFRVLGLRLQSLARATPGSAVAYARPGFPIPSITLLSENGSVAAARRVAHELAPNAQPAVREDVNGLPLEHVALGAVDLYYGRSGHTLVLTNDPQITLGGKHLEPPGLPSSTSEWSYVDVARARPALAALGLLARNTSWIARFDRRFAGLSSYLTYTTHDRGEQTTTVVLH